MKRYPCFISYAHGGIWHNLTKKQVVEYGPIIADSKAMATASMIPEEIAAELKDLFAPTATEENQHEWQETLYRRKGLW